MNITKLKAVSETIQTLTISGTKNWLSCIACINTLNEVIEDLERGENKDGNKHQE